MDRVENDHALGDARRVVLELSIPAGSAAPDSEDRAAGFGAGAGVAPRRGALAALDDVSRECAGCGHYLFSSMICFRSSRISGIGSRATCISPPGPRRMTMLNLPNDGFLSGKSSRKCPPRLSRRSSAALATI